MNIAASDGDKNVRPIFHSIQPYLNFDADPSDGQDSGK
jgi:hypothetical protein